MKAHPSCRHFPWRIEALPRRTGFCHVILAAMLCPQTSWFCLFFSPSAPCFLAHPMQWFTYLPSTISILSGCHVLVCPNGVPPLGWLCTASVISSPRLLSSRLDLVPVSSSLRLVHPRVMNQVRPSDITPTATAEPLLSLLPSTSHCSHLPKQRRARSRGHSICAFHLLGSHLPPIVNYYFSSETSRYYILSVFSFLPPSLSYLCVCVCVCSHAHMHTQTRTHTHTQPAK